MAHVASETRAAQTITNAAVKPTVINAFAGRETSAGSRAEQVWKGDATTEFRIFFILFTDYFSF